MNAPETKANLAPAIEMESKALSYTQPKQSALSESAERVLQLAKAFTIDSPEMAEMAAGELTKIKARVKQLDEERKSITQPIDQAKANVMSIYKPAIEKLGQAETFLKQALLGYQQEQERIAREEAAKRERIAREEAAKLEAKAAKLEAKGKVEEAEAARVEAVMTTVAPVVTQAPQKLAGVSTRKVWKAKVSDKLALVKFVASNPAFIHLLDVSESAINAQAKAVKGPSPIDGVVFFEDSTVSARAA